ncbi:unnamed protein product, partial [Polarella glacialis]
LRILSDAIGAELEPNVVTYSSAISACEKGQRWAWACWLLQEMIGRQLEPNVVSCSAAISACGEEGQWHMALVLLAKMEASGPEPNEFSFNAAIRACQRGGCWQGSLWLLAAMRRSRPDRSLTPDLLTFDAVGLACEQGCHTGPMPEILANLRYDPPSVATPHADVNQEVTTLELLSRHGCVDEVKACGFHRMRYGPALCRLRQLIAGTSAMEASVLGRQFSLGESFTNLALRTKFSNMSMVRMTTSRVALTAVTVAVGARVLRLSVSTVPQCACVSSRSDPIWDIVSGPEAVAISVATCYQNTGVALAIALAIFDEELTYAPADARLFRVIVGNFQLRCFDWPAFDDVKEDVSDKLCQFACGQLICSCTANPANASFLEFCEFVNKRWQLPKERVTPLITYLDDENTECVLNQKTIVDALTGTSHPIVGFRVYLSAKANKQASDGQPTDQTAHAELDQQQSDQQHQQQSNQQQQQQQQQQSEQHSETKQHSHNQDSNNSNATKNQQQEEPQPAEVQQTSEPCAQDEQAVMGALQGMWANMKDRNEGYRVYGPEVARMKAGFEPKVFRLKWNSFLAQLEWGSTGRYRLQHPAALPLQCAVWESGDGSGRGFTWQRVPQPPSAPPPGSLLWGGQSYGGGLPLSEFNKLVPPGWRPGIPGYPIKLFFERLKLWYRVTDNAEAQLGILVAGRLQGAPQKIALRLRLPRPVAAGGGYDIGDEALIRLSQEQVIDPANNTIVQEYIPSGLQFLCQALRAIYGLQDQDRTTVALDSFYEFKRGHLGLAEFAQEFDHRYESAEDEAGLQMNDTGKTYFFLRGSGLGDKIIEDIKLQMRGDMSRYQEIRTLVLKLARANDKDKETLNMYQDQTDFNYKVNLDETNGNYYGSWHDPTTGEIIEYDYGANTSDDMYYGDYDCVYDGEYSDYDGAGYDDDWYGDDGWQDEVYHGDFPLEEWTWPASAPDSISVSTAETTLLDVDPSYWKGQTKGKGKGFGAKGKGPSGGSASGIGCATCGSRWHSSLDCPLNDPSKGDQGKGKGGKDYHYENFWKGKGKGKKGGKSKGFGKGWSKGFGKYRPSFGSGKGYGKYSGGYGKSYGKSYGKGKFKGGYGGFRYSSPYNFTAFQDYEVQEAPEHAPTIAFKADGSGTQYYDFEDDKPSSSTRPPPQSTTEPMIDTAGNPGYNDGYGELDTATAPVPDVRVNSLSFLVGTCSSAFPTDHEDWSSLYHSVRGVKRHGLLIDPGAASGLIGSDTLKEFRDEILLPLGVDIICRPTTQNVSGISGKPEPALSRVTMPIFPGIKSSTFTADVIGKQGSKCPALSPNPSMRAANMGLLTNFFENGDGMLIVHDNGKRLLYRCLLTESGHYILPTDNVKNNNNVDKEATRKASAFYAAVLQDATQQWSDISSVYLAVDKAAVADSVADHAPPSTRSTGWKQSLDITATNSTVQPVTYNSHEDSTSTPLTPSEALQSLAKTRPNAPSLVVESEEASRAESKQQHELEKPSISKQLEQQHDLEQQQNEEVSRAESMLASADLDLVGEDQFQTDEEAPGQDRAAAEALGVAGTDAQKGMTKDDRDDDDSDGDVSLEELEDKLWMQKAALQQVRADYDARLQRNESFRGALKDLKGASLRLQVESVKAGEALGKHRHHVGVALMRAEDGLAHGRRILDSKSLSHRLVKKLWEEQDAEMQTLRRSRGHVSPEVAQEVLKEQRRRIDALREDSEAQNERLLRVGGDLKSILDFMVRVNIEASGGPSVHLRRKDLFSSEVFDSLDLSELSQAHLAEILLKYEACMAEYRGEEYPARSLRQEAAEAFGEAHLVSSASATTASLLQLRPPPPLPSREPQTSSFVEERQLLRKRLVAEMQQVASMLASEDGIGKQDDVQEELLRAAAWGELRSLQELLSSAVGSRAASAPSKPSLCNWTAWHSAAAHGQAPVLEFLASQPLLPKDSSGSGFASSQPSALVAEALSERTACGLPPLALACLRGHVESVRSLLHAKAKLQERDGRGNTALHWAAAAGSDRTAGVLAKLLLEAKADPFACNSCGQTANVDGLQELALTVSTSSNAQPQALGEPSPKGDDASDDDDDGQNDAYFCIRAEQAAPKSRGGFLSQAFGLGLPKEPARDKAGVMRRAGARQAVHLSPEESDSGVWSEWVANYTHAGLQTAVSSTSPLWCSPTNRELSRQALVLTSERLLLLHCSGSSSDASSTWSVVHGFALPALQQAVVPTCSEGILVLRAHGMADVLLNLPTAARTRFLEELCESMARALWPGRTLNRPNSVADSVVLPTAEPVLLLLDGSPGGGAPIATLAFIESEVFLLMQRAPSSLLLSGSKTKMFGFLDLQKRVQPKTAGAGVCWRWQRYFFLLKGQGDRPSERCFGWCHHPNSKSWVGCTQVDSITQLRQVVARPGGDTCLVIDCKLEPDEISGGIAAVAALGGAMKRKRPQDFDAQGMNGMSRPSKMIGSAIKMLVSSKEASQVIGPAGATIKSISEMSGATLHLSSKFELYPGTQMQELSLKSASPDSVMSGVLQVLAKLSEETGKVLGGEWDVEEGGARLHFILPTLAARSVIGKGGETIKMLRASSGMKVHVEEISIGEGEMAEQVVSLAGPLMGVQIALPTLLEKIAECVMLPWFTNWAYNVNAAGGKGGGKGMDKGMMKGKGKGKGKDFGGGCGGDFGGCGGGGGFGGCGGGGGFGGCGGGGGSGAATQSNVDMLSMAVSSLPAAIANPTDRSQKLQFNCPQACVSAIIGKAGAGIKEISMATDSKISIKDIEGNPAEKAVLITGGAIGIVSAYLHVAGRISAHQEMNGGGGGAGFQGGGAQAYDPMQAMMMGMM